MQFLLPRLTEAKGIRVLTSKQIADMYGTTTDVIKKNFSNNRRHFLEGKHYISLAGDDLRTFKNKVKDIHLVGNTARILYIWTEKGALLHAKSVNTDKAWQAYEFLVDYYFRVREDGGKNEIVPTKQKIEPVKNGAEIPVMEEPVFIFKNLLAMAEEQDINFKLKDLHGYFSVLKGKRIAIRKNLEFEKVVYELAYELSHYFIHHNQGDLIKSPLSKDYNEQAEKAACMIIRLLDIKAKQRY